MAAKGLKNSLTKFPPIWGNLGQWRFFFSIIERTNENNQAR